MTDDEIAEIWKKFPDPVSLPLVTVSGGFLDNPQLTGAAVEPTLTTLRRSQGATGQAAARRVGQSRINFAKRGWASRKACRSGRREVVLKLAQPLIVASSLVLLAACSPYISPPVYPNVPPPPIYPEVAPASRVVQEQVRRRIVHRRHRRRGGHDQASPSETKQQVPEPTGVAPAPAEPAAEPRSR